jgi:hypothetical protein
MSFLVTIHLDNRLWAHQRARCAAGTRRFRDKLGMAVTLSIELRRYPNSSLGAKRHTKMTGFAFFVVNDYFTLHSPTKIIKIKNFNSKQLYASTNIFRNGSKPESGKDQPARGGYMKS